MLAGLTVSLSAPLEVDIDDVDAQMPRGAAEDAIRAIDDPTFGDGAWLDEDDPVIGVQTEAGTRAYPVRVLDYHEIVNDEIAGVPVAVTFCPLCGSGVAYERRVDGRTLTFGVSGRLFRNDLVMFDRETRSLWPQILGQAVTGPLEGTALTRLDSVQTTWSAWRKRHPDTVVLERPDLYRPSTYATRSHEGYEDQPGALFERTVEDGRLPPKRWVLGAALGGDALAVPLEDLAAVQTVQTQLAGIEVTLSVDDGLVAATAADGSRVQTLVCYWFAWVEFHPDTRVIEPSG